MFTLGVLGGSDASLYEISAFSEQRTDFVAHQLVVPVILLKGLILRSVLFR